VQNDRAQEAVVDNMTGRLRFVRRQHEADNIETFCFEPEVALAFQAGQYLRYALPHVHPDTRGTTRTFTIASAPSEPLLRLTTRINSQPSSFKQALTDLAPGAVIEVTGPYGQFVYGEPGTPIVLIAGGIGITPFRSILAELAARHVHATTTLLYSNASPDIAFRDFFSTLTPDWPQLHLVYTVTRPDATWLGPIGRIDGEFIQQHVPDPTRCQYFVCGPTALVDAIRATLGEIGVEAGRIKHEGFPGYESAGAPAVPTTEVAMPSFARDIRPLFRDKDVEEMRFVFDLSVYEDVRSNAAGIYDRLADGSMPCDQTWPADSVALFRQWMDDGYSA
jgi:ferredoxin-NADP reductase